MLVCSKLKAHGFATSGQLNGRTDPWDREDDRGITATGTKLLIVIKRVCADAQHQIWAFDNPKSGLGS